MSRDDQAHKRIDELANIILDMQQAHLKTEAALTRNAELTQQIANNTNEMVELFKSTKGFLNGVSWIRRAAIAAASLVAAWYAILHYMRGD